MVSTLLPDRKVPLENSPELLASLHIMKFVTRSIRRNGQLYKIGNNGKEHLIYIFFYSKTCFSEGRMGPYAHKGCYETVM